MIDTPKITIAVDGYSSCGKSTLARDLAKKLHYIFIDSGSMYRGIALYAIRHELFVNGKLNEEGLVDILDQIELHFERNPNGEPELILNGENVALEIRSTAVSSVVSLVARVHEVREKLVILQRKIGSHGGIVMDGRDIGSVVFPKAELKLFVTADIDVRVERRYKELREKGIEVTREQVRTNLTERDFLDTTRKESPLVQTPDAIVIDNSHLDREQQLIQAYQLVTGLFKTHN